MFIKYYSKEKEEKENVFNTLKKKNQKKNVPKNNLVPLGLQECLTNEIARSNELELYPSTQSIGRFPWFTA